MADTLESLLRGAGQGATAGFSDEAIAKLLASMPGPDDSAAGGIPREYAAGSAESDYLQNERGANANAAKSNPVTYGAGSLAGALPSALAIPGGIGGSGAARIAAGGLSGGALGGLSGAGHADGKNIGKEIGKGAALGGTLGTVGGAAIEAMPFMKAAMSSVGGPQMQPAMAGASGAMGGAPGSTAQQLGGAQINRMGILPPRPATGDMPTEMFIPRGGKNLVKEGAIDASEDLADASMVSNTADTILGGERASQKVARGEATDAFKKANVSSKPAAASGGGGTTMKGTVPPKRGKAAQARNAQTVPAPAEGNPTFRAPAPDFPITPSMHPTYAPPANMRPTAPAPAPQGTPSMRPTMPAMGPISPTMKPASQKAYMDEVLRQMREGLPQ